MNGKSEKKEKRQTKEIRMGETNRCYAKEQDDKNKGQTKKCWSLMLCYFLIDISALAG